MTIASVTRFAERPSEMKNWIFTAVNSALFGASSAAAVYEPESRLMMCVVAMNALAWTVANINQGVGR